MCTLNSTYHVRPIIINHKPVEHFDVEHSVQKLNESEGLSSKYFRDDLRQMLDEVTSVWSKYDRSVLSETSSNPYIYVRPEDNLRS